MAVTVIITLTPFNFESAPVHGFTHEWSTTDLVMNVVMFMPLGFLVSLSRSGRQLTVALAFLLGLGLSAAIETAQLFEPERFTSVLDIATNGAGALIGAILHDVVIRILSATADNGVPVRALALELPLMGLVYLLVPLVWLIGLGGDTNSRLLLALPVCAFAGSLLGAVHGGYLLPLRRTSRALLVAASVGFATAAGILVAKKSVAVFAAMIAVTIVASILQSHVVVRRITSENRRFELPSLRASLPLFAAYVALSTLWPLDGADMVWRSGVRLFPAERMAHGLDIYRALEQVAAFTLVGYICAELRGRSDRSFTQMFASIAAWGLGLAALLEATRGFHAMYGASLLMWFAASAATLFGGWMYCLQRDHVRALGAQDATASSPEIEPELRKAA